MGIRQLKFEKSEIIDLFNKEFAGVRDLFEIIDIRLDAAETDKNEAAAKPGVYVYWKGREVLKVGRHLLNSRKRALEHVNVPEEKGYPMTAYNKCKSEISLLLFNVKEHAPKKGIDHRHWVAALEIFFELRLDPEVTSGRLG